MRDTTIEINNNKHVYHIEWAECSLIIGTGCRVKVFSLILDSSVGLPPDIQSAGDLVSQTLGSSLAFSRGRQLVSCDSKISCLSQSIEINNYKHLYRQSQVRKPTGSGVEWAECSLIIGTGCQVQVFSLILDSSVGLSAGIQSAGDLLSETLGPSPTFSRGRQLISCATKIACLCQSIKINSKHVYRQSQVRKPTGSGVEWVKCFLIIGTGC